MCLELSNVIFGHQRCHQHHSTIVAPPVQAVQGLGSVVSKFGEDLSSGSEVVAQNVYGVSFFFGHHNLHA